MQTALLTLNAGSASLKFALYPLEKSHFMAQPLLKGKIEILDQQIHFKIQDGHGQLKLDETAAAPQEAEHHQAFALEQILTWLENNISVAIEVIGHRVVHGGDQFYQACRINESILAELEKYSSLAPLHQPYNIAAMRTLMQRWPACVQIASFDTAFHRSQTPVAQAFALPDGLGPIPIKRYGFHGLSYHSIAESLPRYLGSDADKKVIVAHLGQGASLCALERKQSVATTMGFTALDGLPMGTRSGTIDPGIILYLFEQQGWSCSQIQDLLYHRSGLFGVSQESADLRTLLKSQRPEAQFALDLFVYRVVRELGSLMMSLGGFDHLIFTGGMGEHAAPIRARICAQLAWLGLQIDAAANAQHQVKISAPTSAISVWVIPTDEEIIIAKSSWECWHQSRI